MSSSNIGPQPNDRITAPPPPMQVPYPMDTTKPPTAQDRPREGTKIPVKAPAPTTGGGTSAAPLTNVADTGTTTNVPFIAQPSAAATDQTISASDIAGLKSAGIIPPLDNRAPATTVAPPQPAPPPQVPQPTAPQFAPPPIVAPTETTKPEDTTISPTGPQEQLPQAPQAGEKRKRSEVEDKGIAPQVTGQPQAQPPTQDQTQPPSHPAPEKEEPPAKAPRLDTGVTKGPDFDPDSLAGMNRKDLQQLAKLWGIKANQKTEVIIQQLRERHAATATTAPSTTANEGTH